MCNHAHLLLRTGSVAVSSIMRRLLTGCAVRFNRRHRRHGHLFQNRYRSILCEADRYLRQLVAYIHLNPVRAGIVGDVTSLKAYPFTGHSALMGRALRPWQDTPYVLALFGKSVSEARRNLQRHVARWAAKGRRPELTGGGSEVARRLNLDRSTISRAVQRVRQDAELMATANTIWGLLKPAISQH